MRRFANVLLACIAVAVTGCSSFPTARLGATFDDGLSAQQVFDACLAAHGGDLRQHDGDINLSTDGHWHALIQKIQPLVSDAQFRVTSQERYSPREGIYAVHHQGPGGSKQVMRTRDGVSVAYNGMAATDAATISATRMTNDAFQMFHFGPSFFVTRTTAMTRLPDRREGGRGYRLLLATVRPGFGDSAEDHVVLWIDATTSRLWRVHMTLQGFQATQGAHVDTTFLAYREVGGYLLPTTFFERVRGPVRITAHEWHTTGIDMDRGWSKADVTGTMFTGKAAAPATPLSAGSDDVDASP